MNRILPVLIFSFLAHAQPAPSAFTVSNLADSGPGSLRQAILSANSQPGAAITFAPEIRGAITLTSGELTVLSSMQINGPGAQALSISGNGNSRVFDIEGAGSVAISGLAITHGLAGGASAHPGLGGGIFASNTALALQGVIVASNQALGTANTPSEIPGNVPLSGAGAGGGIYLNSGTLTLTGCALAGNQAQGGSGLGDGGGSNGVGLGGGLFVASGNVIANAVLVQGNRALGGSGGSTGGAGGTGLGGGIYNNGLLTLGTISVLNNMAQGGSGGSGAGGGAGLGGGIYTGNGALAITNATLAGNQAVGGSGGSMPSGNGLGGGLAIGPGAQAVVTSAFIGSNSAVGQPCPSVFGCGPAPGSGAGLGGGIYGDTTSTLTLDRSAVLLNQANGTPGMGGGIYDPGTLVLDPRTVIALNRASTSYPNLYPPRP